MTVPPAPSQRRWWQPPRDRTPRVPAWVEVGGPIGLGAATLVAAAVGIAEMPVLLGVAAIGAGVALGVRRWSAAGGPWRDFVPPPGLTFRPSDPELGARFGDDLDFLGHGFENVLEGTGAGGWPWTYFEATRPGVRDRRVVLDLGRELPRVAAVRRTKDPGARYQAGESMMPATIYGRTGAYGFPQAQGANDPHVLTMMVTPTMQVSLQQAVVPRWEVHGRWLVGWVDSVLGRSWALGSIQAVVADLCSIARSLTEAFPEQPGERPRIWPTL